MTTPILALDELAASQSQPHVPLNAAVRALEAAANLRVINQTTAVPPSSPAEGDRYIVAPGASGDWLGHDYEVTYYSGGWQFLAPETGWVAYDVALDDFYQYAAGSPTGWALFAAAADTAAIEADIVALQAAVAALQAVVDPYDVGGGTAGAPTASQVLLRYPFPRTVAFPASLTNSRGTAGTAATAQTDFDLRKNGVSFGTMRFAAAGTTASFIAASSSSFAAGDVLTVVSPASPDATLAGVGFSLAGTR